MPHAPELARQSPLPIIIGVTGHRDLRCEDVPRLTSSFEQALGDIGQRYPDSSFVLLSSLADGADRLAARVALACGVELVVPLPLPRPLYEDDFVTSESRDEFACLIGQARAVIDLPLLPGVSLDDVRQPGAARNLEYAKVGEYIGRQSQLFIAFWDGVPGSQATIGGTGYTVNLRLAGSEGRKEPRRRFRTFSIQTGPVIQIETPRASCPQSWSLTGQIRTHVPPGATLESFDQICVRMDQFNRDARRLRTRLDKGRSERQAQLINADGASAQNVLRSLPASCRQIADHYATADGLALHFARRTSTTLKHVSFGVAAAAVLFNMHSSYFAVSAAPPVSVGEAIGTFPWYLAGFLILSTFTASWIYGRAERLEYQTKYLDYRSLAEAIRIQFFWRVTGVADAVVESYLRNQRSELEWLRSALKSFDVMTAAGGPGVPSAGAMEFGLLMSWIRDQRRYFSAKAKKEARRRQLEIELVKRLLQASAGMSVVLALVLALPFLTRLAFGTPSPSLISSDWHAFLMVLIPMCAVAAGLLDRYSHMVARAEHIRQFASMSALFDAGERELETLLNGGGYAAAAVLARNLGREALDDNGDWLILHRERPLELPPG